MKIEITKRKPAINWYMLILALAITINLMVQLTLMIIYAPESRFVIGLSLSFIGFFLYGFNFTWAGKRIVYFKEYKTYFQVKELTNIQSNTERSSSFVTEDGNLLNDF
ncbi:MAG TPA: hypothetical protein ACFCUD_01435 [Cyclobacteriaceae bacterium]